MSELIETSNFDVSGTVLTQCYLHNNIDTDKNTTMFILVDFCCDC